MVSVSLLVAVATVRAAPTAADRDTARALMVEGDRLQAVGDLRSALERYRSAHAIMRVPTTGLSVARVQANLGMLVEARSSAMEVINLPVGANEPAVFADARRTAHQLAGELEPRVPSLQTTISPADAAYTLTIDGVTLPMDARQVPYRMNPGVHSVRVEAGGYAPEVREVTLAEGRHATLAISLQPSAAQAHAPLPAPVPSTDPSIQVPSPAEATAVHNPAAPGKMRGILGLSLGGAVLIAGGVTGIASVVKTSTIEKHCDDGSCDKSQADAISSANTLANVANVCVPLGVLGVAYGLYELLTLPDVPDRPHATHATPANGAQAGLTLELTATGAVLRGPL